MYILRGLHWLWNRLLDFIAWLTQYDKALRQAKTPKLEHYVEMMRLRSRR